MRSFMRALSLRFLTLNFALLVASFPAFAACTSPSGNPGDVIYSSVANIMVYCNGTSWISMGTSSTTSFGTLTNGNFCTATSGTSIACNTSAINLATMVSGGLGIANGGTNSTSQITNGINYYNGTNITSNSSFVFNGTQVGIGTPTPLANLTVNGTAAFMFSTDYTTTGSQSDVAINIAATVRYNGASAATFYGIVAGVNGQVVYLHNASSSTLVLSNQSGSEATAANRIITGTGSDLSMASNSSVILQYDATAGRWRVIGGSGGGSAAGSTGQVQYNGGSGFAGDSNFSYSAANTELVVGTGAATPIGVGTSGAIASGIVNFIPRSIAVTPSGITGITTVNAGSAGQAAYYSGANAISGTSNLYFSGSNVGIGTTSPAVALHVSSSVALPLLRLDRNSSSTRKSFISLAQQGTSRWEIGDDLTDANTQNFFIWDDAAAAARLYIDANGNVGIGTTVPVGLLDIANNAKPSIFIRDYTGTNGTLKIGNAGGANFIESGVTTSSASSAPLYFTDMNASHTWMYIGSTGNVGIGNTSPAARLGIDTASNWGKLSIDYNGATAFAGGFNNTDTGSAGQTVFNFLRNSTSVGNIYTTNVATTYSTTSDRRIKENIAPTARGLEVLEKISVDDFNFIADPKQQKLQGFIAQDLYTIYPEAVNSNGDDGTKPLAKGATPWSVDYGRLTPLLVKSIQEQQNEINALKADNDNLRRDEDEKILKLEAAFDAYKTAHP